MKSKNKPAIRAHAICAIILGAALCVFFTEGYAEYLNVPLCPQIQTQWCWAASSEGLLKFYGINKKQTECANVITTQNSPQPMSAIQKILTKFNCPNVYKSSGVLTFDQIKTETDNLHPFCVFWHWTSGGGHFVDCAGYKDDIIKIMNPWPPNQGAWNQGTYDYVKNAQNKGNWSGYITTTMSLLPFIKVMYPKGKENLEIGKSYSLAWSDNISGNVKIDLYKNGALQAKITASAPSSGAYSWTIPDSIPVGSTYKIRITSIDSSALYSESDSVFSITKSTGISNGVIDKNSKSLLLFPTILYADTRQLVTFHVYTNLVATAAAILEIYDMSGRVVYRKTTADASKDFTWDLRDQSGARVGSGSYAAAVTLSGTTDITRIAKITVIK